MLAEEVLFAEEVFFKDVFDFLSDGADDFEGGGCGGADCERRGGIDGGPTRYRIYSGDSDIDCAPALEFGEPKFGRTFFDTADDVSSDCDIVVTFTAVGDAGSCDGTSSAPVFDDGCGSAEEPSGLLRDPGRADEQNCLLRSPVRADGLSGLLRQHIVQYGRVLADVPSGTMHVHTVGPGGGGGRPPDTPTVLQSFLAVVAALVALAAQQTFRMFRSTLRSKFGLGARMSRKACCETRGARMSFCACCEAQCARNGHLTCCVGMVPEPGVGGGRPPDTPPFPHQIVSTRGDMMLLTALAAACVGVEFWAISMLITNGSDFGPGARMSRQACCVIPGRAGEHCACCEAPCARIGLLTCCVGIKSQGARMSLLACCEAQRVRLVGMVLIFAMTP